MDYIQSTLPIQNHKFSINNSNWPKDFRVLNLFIMTNTNDSLPLPQAFPTRLGQTFPVSSHFLCRIEAPCKYFKPLSIWYVKTLTWSIDKTWFETIILCKSDCINGVNTYNSSNASREHGNRTSRADKTLIECYKVFGMYITLVYIFTTKWAEHS